ncbi:MAG: BatA domain-containing protein [Acidobacteriota bacterium]|nr:BatA domain-containing protein [Acidobacteriota bacterium]
MPVFTFPIALFALLATPVLVAIYWLRNRAKERQVSSLLFWMDVRQRWEGGQTIHRLQMPLLFVLELLAIVLLAMAAAKPLMRAGDAAKPLVVVLDDSFSMQAGGQAGGEDSSRNRAARAVESELRVNRYEPARFVLAGETPQVLGETTGSGEQVSRLLQNWKCGAATAKLNEAVAFAFELGGKRARVLVASDHAPAQEISDSRLQWWAFGSSLPNVGFINATRSARGDEERVMLEIANLSPQSATANLTIETGDQQTPQSFQLAANESRRITMTIKNSAGKLRARLGEDGLSVDNQIVLLPELSKIVRVELQLADAGLRELIEKAVESSSQVRLSSEKPELVITDAAEANVADAESWTLQLLNESSASSYLGPFVVDKAHPLTDGLSLGGVVWAAGKAELPGAPIITAGNIALLTDVDRAGRHELRLRLKPELSTVQQTPNWPILISNLIAWRASVAPGLHQSNVRLGGEATLIADGKAQTVTVSDPKQTSRQLAVRDGSVAIKADLAGEYTLQAETANYAFAANAISREESDLTNAASGRWGNWANATSLEWEYRSFVWLLLIVVLALLSAHAWLANRRNAA